MPAHRLLFDRDKASKRIPDPGNAGTIDVTRSGVCVLSTAGAETRTLPNPVYLGQEIVFCLSVNTGTDVDITNANQIGVGTTTATLGTVGDTVGVYAINIAGNLRWAVSMNDGAVLA